MVKAYAENNSRITLRPSRLCDYHSKGAWGRKIDTTAQRESRIDSNALLFGYPSTARTCLLPFFIMFRLHIVFQRVSFCGSTMNLTIVEDVAKETVMKKLGLIGLVILTAAGCGHGWLPFRPFRGAPCGASCMDSSAPVYSAEGCTGCAGYPSYEGEQVIGEYNSPAVGSGYYNTPSTTMGPITSGT